MTLPKFSGTSQSFHSELKKRISDYFNQAGKAPTGNCQLYFKAIFLTVAFIAVYIHLVFYTPATWLALTECVVLGGLTAAIGFNRNTTRSTVSSTGISGQLIRCCTSGGYFLQTIKNIF